MRRNVVGGLVLLIVMLGSCATPGPVERTVVERVVVQDAAPGVVVDGDYFGEGIVLCGVHEHSFETSLYDIPFYPATVITAASTATKDEARVRIAATGADLWTRYVIESRPAEKGELAEGILVFYAGDADARTPEELAAIDAWRIGSVKDVSNLYRDTVIVEYHDGYWNEWREYTFNWQNLRIVTVDITTEL